MNPSLLITTTSGSSAVNDTSKNMTLSPNTVQAIEELTLECMNIGEMLSFSSGLIIGCSLALIFILFSAYTKNNRKNRGQLNKK